MGKPSCDSIYFIVTQCVESNSLEKSTNNCVAKRVFPLAPYMIWM